MLLKNSQGICHHQLGQGDEISCGVNQQITDIKKKINTNFKYKTFYRTKIE